jgi:hypothetical protein
MLGAIIGPGKFCGTSLLKGEGPEARAGASHAKVKRQKAKVKKLSVRIERVPTSLVFLTTLPFYFYLAGHRTR